MPKSSTDDSQKKKGRSSKGLSLEGLSLPPGFEEQFAAAAKEAAGKPLSMEPDSPLGRMIGLFVEHALNEELGEHLGYKRHQRLEPEDSAAPTRRQNTRNGHSSKRLKTSMGSTEIRVPRDRNGEFEPKLLPKHQTMSSEIEHRVLGMYAGGMTTRDIAEQVRELYHFDASENFVSRLVERIEPLLVAWRNRVLEAIYAILYIDAIHLKIRHSSGVASTAAYIVSGYGEDGTHSVLGVWIAPSSHSSGHGESASFWLIVLEELRARGLNDALHITSDALSGLDVAIATVFPSAVHLPCVVHQMRQSLAPVTFAQRKAVAADLKRIYQAPSYEAAEQALVELGERHEAKHPRLIKQWRALLPRLTVLWTMSPPLRTMVYTTNPVENINRQLRKVTKNRSVFPSIESALRLATMALMKIDERAGARKPRPDWNRILNELNIKYEGRIPPNWGHR